VPFDETNGYFCRNCVYLEKVGKDYPNKIDLESLEKNRIKFFPVKFPEPKKDS
jgi:hypothetical protein